MGSATGTTHGVGTLAFIDRRPQDQFTEVRDHVQLRNGMLRRVTRFAFDPTDDVAELAERDGRVALVAFERQLHAGVGSLTFADADGNHLRLLSDRETRLAFMTVLSARLETVLRSEPSELDEATTGALCLVLEHVVCDVLRLPAGEAMQLVGRLFRWSNQEALATLARRVEEAGLAGELARALPEGVDAIALLQHALLTLKADTELRSLVIRLATKRFDVVVVPLTPRSRPAQELTVSYQTELTVHRGTLGRLGGVQRLLGRAPTLIDLSVAAYSDDYHLRLEGSPRRHVDHAELVTVDANERPGYHATLVPFAAGGELWTEVDPTHDGLVINLRQPAAQRAGRRLQALVTLRGHRSPGAGRWAATIARADRPAPTPWLAGDADVLPTALFREVVDSVLARHRLEPPTLDRNEAARHLVERLRATAPGGPRAASAGDAATARA